MSKPARAELAASPGVIAGLTPARLFSLVFFVACAVAVWPLCTPHYLPIGDLPQHLAAIRVLHSYEDPNFGFEQYFELDLLGTQYLAYYVLAHWLSYVFDLEFANRLIVVGTAFATPYALRFLLKALGREQWPALFALPLTFNAHLLLGFINFLMAIPLALVGLGLAVRQRGGLHPSRAGLLALVALVCFFSHVVPFALLVVGCFILALDRDPRAFARRLMPLIPAGLASLVWLTRSKAARTTLAAARGDTAAPQVHYMPKSFLWADLPNWLTDILQGDDDAKLLRIFVGLLASSFALGLARLALAGRGRREGDSSEPPSNSTYLLLLPLAPLSFLLYFVTPTAYDWIWPIAQRFPLLALIFLIPVLPSPPRAAGAAVAAALVVLTVAQTRVVSAAFSGFDRDEVGDFEQALAAIPPDSKVMGLIFARGSRYVKFSPFLHFVAYYQARKGGAVMFTFADFPQSPFRFRTGDRPPRVAPRWEWLPQRVREPDTAWYEYILVRAGPSPCTRSCERVYHGALWSVWKRR